jgi:uncharacterized oligopeptide transporter (OPT) family protein
MKPENELNARTVILGCLLCALAAAATPYVTLKLGQSVDLTLGGMFLAAFVLGKRVKGRALAVQLNLIQSMIGMVSGIAFMVVILAAFFYIKALTGRDIGFHPSSLQMFLWLVVSANLGVFMGIVPRSSILKDRKLPWPTSRATLRAASFRGVGPASSTRNRRPPRDPVNAVLSLSSTLLYSRATAACWAAPPLAAGKSTPTSIGRPARASMASSMPCSTVTSTPQPSARTRSPTSASSPPRTSTPVGCRP